MAAAVSIEHYLRRVYRPDREFVDGIVLSRNAGLWNHGRTLAHVLTELHTRSASMGAEVLPTLRLRVSPTRVRVPDVCVFLEDPHEQVPSRPPFLCVEVTSPRDRFSDLVERIQDFFQMGVPNVWIVSPESKAAYTVTPADGWREVKDGVLRTAHPAFDVPLAEIFA